MFNNIKFPTLIISSPRTGSTILGDYISQLNDHVKFFSEPHLNLDHYREFLEYSKNSNNFILKIHARDYHNYDLNLTDFYIIRLQRRDVIDQIASYYLADIRKKFGYDNNNEYKDYMNSMIEYDFKVIDMIINTTLTFNRFLDNFDRDFSVTFDQDLWYEDLNFDLNKIDFDLNDHLNRKHRMFKTPYPKNYNILKAIISKKLDNKSDM